jgi:tRNA pseudouridine(38-40) synthase
MCPVRLSKPTARALTSSASSPVQLCNFVTNPPPRLRRFVHSEVCAFITDRLLPAWFALSPPTASPPVQVCAFTTESAAADDLGKLLYSSNQMLPPDVRIHSATLVPVSFDPRDNRGKEYHYRFSVSPRANPLLDGPRGQRWHLPPRRGAPSWDAPAVSRAARLLLGTHSFAAFANSPRGSERVAAAAAAAAGSSNNPVCRLSMVQLRTLGTDEFLFRVRGDRFMYKMVRNMVGALVKVQTQLMQHACACRGWPAHT